VTGQVVALTDPNYGGAWMIGTRDVEPEDVMVTYTGDASIPEGSATPGLTASVAQADYGAPGDLSRPGCTSACGTSAAPELPITRNRRQAMARTWRP
jgi:hypothetical protein